LLTAFLVSFWCHASNGQAFRIKVVDSQTGRGVPLVELTPLGGQKQVTDSNGILTLSDASLLNSNKFWGVQSYGYSDQGRTIQTTPGGVLEFAIDRRNLAERLYRVTGPSIYGETVEAGLSAPIVSPLHNANVLGQDSVQTAIYQGQIHWFWGDTLYEVGFGNFRTAGAVSQLPGTGGLDPSVGVNLQYFVNNVGSSREMMPLPDPGPIWMDGVFVIPGASGEERLLGHYSRIEPGSATFNVLEHGLALYDDSTQTFQRLQTYNPTAPITPQGHAFHNSIAGVDYVYFTQSYPSVRVRANWQDVTNVAQWEAFTPLVAGARYDSENPDLERDAHGNIVFGWKQNADPLTSDMLNDLVQRGHMAREESPFRLEDSATGRDIFLHRASVQWNEYRQAWVMVGTEAFGASFLGEVWYSEAPTPEGPWVNAIKVVSHDRGTSSDYTFYNPALHPYFDQEGGRFIYFEGTYANTFSGNSLATPLYDYNQMMYRLDLSEIPRLAPLRADYDDDGDVDGEDLLVWQRLLGDTLQPRSGADGDGTGFVDFYDLAAWQGGFGSSSDLPGESLPPTATIEKLPEPGGLLMIVCTCSLRAFQTRRRIAAGASV
jgi:hypothetical protein